MQKGQFWHLVLEALVQTWMEYRPAKQAEQLTQTEGEDSDCPVEYVPAKHPKHSADRVAPVPVQYVPAGQDVHTDTPTNCEYLPPGQDRHDAVLIAPLPVWYFPAMQS